MTTKPDYHQHYPISSRAPSSTRSGGGEAQEGQQAGVAMAVEGGHSAPFPHQHPQPLPLTSSPATGMVTLNPLFASPHAHSVGVSFNGVANFAPLAPPLPPSMPLPVLPFPAAEHPLPPPPSSSVPSTSGGATSEGVLPPPPPPPPPPYSTLVPTSHLPFSTADVPPPPPPPQAHQHQAPHTLAPLVVVAPLPLPYPPPLPSGSSPFFAPAPPAAGFSPFAAFGAPFPYAPAAAGGMPMSAAGGAAPATMHPHAHLHPHPQMLTPWPPVPLRHIDEFLAQGVGGVGGGGGNGDASIAGGGGGGGGAYLFPHPFAAAQGMAMHPVPASAPSPLPPPPALYTHQHQQPVASATSAPPFTYPISSSSPSATLAANVSASPTTSSSMSSTPVPPHYQQQHHQQQPHPPPPPAQVQQQPSASSSQAQAQPAYAFPPFVQAPVPVPTTAADAAVALPVPPPVATAVSTVPPSAGHAPTHVPPPAPVAAEEASSGTGTGTGPSGGDTGGTGSANGKCAVETVLRGGVELPLPPSGPNSPPSGKGRKTTQKLFRCVACGRKSTMQHPASSDTPAGAAADAASPAAPPQVSSASPPAKAGAALPAALTPTSPADVTDADALAFSIKYFSTGPAPALQSASPPLAPSPSPPPLPPAAVAPVGYVSYPFGYPLPMSPSSVDEASLVGGGGELSHHARQESFDTLSSLSSASPSVGYHPQLYPALHAHAHAQPVPTYDFSTGEGVDPLEAGAAQQAAALVPGLHGLGVGLGLSLGAEGQAGGLLPPFVEGGQGAGGEEPDYPISSARTLAAEQAALEQERVQQQQQRAETEGRSVPPHLRATAALAFSSASLSGRGRGGGRGQERPSTAMTAEEREGEGVGRARLLRIEREEGRKGRSRSEGSGMEVVASPASYLPLPPPVPPRTPSPSSSPFPNPAALARSESESCISTPSTMSPSSPYTPYQPHPIPVCTPSSSPPAFRVPGTAVNVTPAIVVRAREQQQKTGEPLLRAANTTAAALGGGGGGKPYRSPPFSRSTRPGVRGPYATAPLALAPSIGAGDAAVASGANAYALASANPFAAPVAAAASSSSAVSASEMRAYGPGGLPRRPGGEGQGQHVYGSPTRPRRGGYVTVGSPSVGVGVGGALGSPFGSPVSARRDSTASSVFAGGGGGGMGSVTSSPVRGGGGYVPGYSPTGARGRSDSLLWTPREPPSLAVPGAAAMGGANDDGSSGSGNGASAPGGGNGGEEWRGRWPVVKVENIPFSTTMQDVLSWLPPGYLAAKEDVPMPIHLVLHRATGRTLPHCYLEVASVDLASRLIQTMDRSTLGDRTVRVKWERPGEMMRDFFSQEVFFQTPDIHRSPAAAPLPHLPPSGYKLPEVVLTSQDLQRIVAYCQRPVNYRERPFERSFYNMVSLIAKFPWHRTEWDEPTRDAMFAAAQQVASQAQFYHQTNPLFQDVIEKLVGVVLGATGFTDEQKEDFRTLAPNIQTPRKLTPDSMASIAQTSSAPVADSEASSPAPTLNRSLAPPETPKMSPSALNEGVGGDLFSPLGHGQEKHPRVDYPPSPPYYRSFPMRGGIGRGGGAAQRDRTTGEWVEVTPSAATATVGSHASASGLPLKEEEMPTPAEAAKVVTSRRGSVQSVKSPESLSTTLPTTTATTAPFQPASPAVSAPSRSASVSGASPCALPATPPASPVATRGGEETAVRGRRKSLRGWASQD
ncbi:hypothetical protein JCM6882_001590 [Rhodosporidiobolus microsporus]